MPISDHPEYPKGHFTEVYEELIKPVVISSGYECQRADDSAASHMIHVEIVNQVVNADLCICDLSTRNPNVLFEYGIRQAYDKPTVLMKDDKTGRIFDVDVFRFCEYDHSLRVGTAKAAQARLSSAIADTIVSQGKDNQLFSLVSFLKLQKAAMSSKDVRPEDARFALIEKRLEAFQYTMERFLTTNINSASDRERRFLREREFRRKAEYEKKLKANLDDVRFAALESGDHVLDLSAELGKPTFLTKDREGDIILFGDDGPKIFETVGQLLDYSRDAWTPSINRKALMFLESIK